MAAAGWTEINFNTALSIYYAGGNLRIEKGVEYWERMGGETSSNSPGPGLVGSQGPARGWGIKYYTC